MIVDASVLLHVFLPDEMQSQALAVVREHVDGRDHLKAPALLPYELGNAVLQAERRGRIQRDQAGRIIESFTNLDIEIVPQAWGGTLPLARQYDRSAYEAAYLALAQLSLLFGLEVYCIQALFAGIGIAAGSACHFICYLSPARSMGWS